MGAGGGGWFIAYEYVRECTGCAVGGGNGAECECTACGREPVCEYERGRGGSW